MKRRKIKQYCNCWLCMTAKEKKVIAREKAKRHFRCGGQTRAKIVNIVNTSE